MRPGRLAGLLLLSATAALAEDQRPVFEISADLVQIKPDGSGASQRGTPSVTCPDGEEAKLFIGQNHPDGAPDLHAVRIEFTPHLLGDGRIEIKVVSLGTELGERPEPAPSADKNTPRPKLTFHSALPADKLFSVAGKDSSRNWLRLGQKVDGWTLASYDEPTKTLTLTLGSQSQRLSLAKASLSDPNPAGPRTETVTILPGQPAEIVGKDGHRIVIRARRLEETAPSR